MLEENQKLDEIAEEIHKIGFDRVRLYLIADRGNELVVSSHIGMDDSFIGTRWSTSAIPFFNSLAQDPRPRLFGTGSSSNECHEPGMAGGEASEWACAPIFDGELKGLITVDNKHRETAIDETILSKLSIEAAKVASLIPVPKNPVEMSAGTEQSEPAQHTTFAVNSIRELPVLLKDIVQQAIQLLTAEGGGIYQYYPEQQELVVAAEFNRDQNVGKTLKVGEGLSGRLVLDVLGDDQQDQHDDGTLFHLDDGTPYRVVADYNSWSGRAELYADGRPFEAVLEVPLKWEGEMVGVLYVDAHKERYFTRQDAELLKCLADDAAEAIVMATLLATSQTKLKSWARLAEVMKELMSDLDKKTLDERLDQVARYAAQILNAEVCGVFLAKEPGIISLEASFGHREGAFQKGKRLKVVTGIGTGLTGHIGAEGKLFNSNGAALNAHPAIRGVEPDCSPSLNCTSLLAIPLKHKTGKVETLVGLIRCSNKKDDAGRALPTLRFTKEDEWILTIFAEAAVTAIESARLVNELCEQKDKLSRVVASSPSCIIAADRTGNITEFNDQARKILGINGNGLTPTHINEVFVSEAEARRVGRELHEGNGRIEKFKTVIKSSDGSLIPIQLSATWLVDVRQNRIGSVGYFEDLRPVEVAEKRLNLFLEANSIVATAANPDEGLQNLAEKLISLLSNSFCRILLLDEDEQHLSVAAAYPITRTDGTITWEPGRGERVAIADYDGLSTFLKTGEPSVMSLRNENHRSLLEKFTQRVGLKIPVQALLMVPLRFGEEVVGLLDIGELRGESTSTSITAQGTDTERRNEPFFEAFSSDKIEMVASVAAQTIFLIERIKLFKAAERRRQLLERLAKKVLELRSIKELKALQYDVVRLAIELVEGKGSIAGALYVNRNLLKSLELSAVYDLPEPVKSLSYEDGPISHVAKTQSTTIVLDYAEIDHEGVFADDFRSMVAIPLGESGNANYVLALGTKSDKFLFGNAEVEVLEQFASQAAIALQTAELLSPDQRLLFNQVRVLHQITQYILSERDYDRILNGILTGITAGYGLRFNRAALLLLDHTGEELVGEHGIGHVNKKLAEDDWEQNGDTKVESFATYLESLKSGPIPKTPVGEWIPFFRLPLAADRSGYFRRAVNECKFSLIPESDFSKLPREFMRGFSPQTEVIVIPLHTRERCVGVLVADNKFNGVKITTNDIDSLITYANTTALAIDNLRLLKRIEVGSETMQSLFKAGTMLRTTNDPNQSLKDIVQLTQKAAEATWVRILLVDELGHPHDLISTGTEVELPPQDLFRPNGVGARVMRTGHAERIEDTHSYQGLNPALHRTENESLLCFPLAMQGRKFGVMWIGYKTSKVFSEILTNALQLFVNQAAIAYDSARRLEELEQMRLTAVALAEAEDPQAVLEQIIKHAHTALRADSAAIWPYDDVRDEFEPDGWVSSQISPELKLEFLKHRPRSNGTAATAMQEGLIEVEDIQEDKYTYLGHTTRCLLRRLRVQSFLGVSLTVGDQRLGVLFLNYTRPRNFTEEEKATARTFANHAATALKRTKLLKYVQRIRKAAESVARVTVIGDVRLTLDAIVKETKIALGCDVVALYDYDRATETLSHPPYMDGVNDREAAMRFEAVERRSIVYQVLQRDEAVFIERAWEAPLTKDRRFREAESIKSVVCIPLTAGGEKVGVMFVNYRHEHHFNEDEKESIGLFANQAAVAIRNAQLFEEQKMRLKDRDSLLELTKELLGKEGVAESMQAVVAAAADLLQVEFCAVVLPEEEGDGLVFNAVYGWDEESLKPIRLEPAYGSQTGYTMKIGEPVVVHEFHKEKRFKTHPLIKELKIRSSLSVPMRSGDEVIGAVLVHTPKPRHFDSDVGLLTLIANQASIALQRARQFEEVNRKRRGRAALYEASKAIAESFRPDREMVLSDRKRVLDEIIKQAVEGITTTATLGMIKLYDATVDEFSFENVYPESKKEELLKRIADLTEDGSIGTSGQRKGVVWKAVEQKSSVLIKDVSQCDFYIKGDPSTQSQLAVPFILDQRVLGVINLESDRVNGFDKDDEANLEALAELAVVVIKNSELFDELIETKSVVDSSNALALMGMTSSIWRHAIKGHAINIRNLPTLMRLDAGAWNLDSTQSSQFETRLKFIESMATKILHKEAIPPLSYEGTIEVASINDLIKDRVVDLWRTEPYSNARYSLNLADQKLNVRISPDWWRIALDILIDNAVSAVRGRTPALITISTRRSKNEIHISISDTGRGIPPDKLPNVLKRPLGADLRSEGLGVGLLIAKTIVETYKGKISLQETSSNGTTFNINLPVAE